MGLKGEFEEVDAATFDRLAATTGVLKAKLEAMPERDFEAIAGELKDIARTFYESADSRYKWSDRVAKVARGFDLAFALTKKVATA